MKIEPQPGIILVTLEREASAGDELETAMRALDAAIADVARFGLLVRTGGGQDAPRTPPEVRERWRAWLDARRDVFETKCQGVALITTRTLLVKLAAPLLRRMFRAPCRPFADEIAARAWLSAQR